MTTELVGDLLKGCMYATDANTKERNETVARLLSQLEKHPELTSCQFSVAEGECISPLMCLLRAGEGVDSIQKLCDIRFELRPLLLRGEFPLQFACLFSSEDIIDCLIRATPPDCPTLKCHRWHNGIISYPFEMAMWNASRPSLETMKLLLQARPKQLSFNFPKTWVLALLSGQSPELLEGIADLHPDPAPHHTFQMDTAVHSFAQLVERASPLNLVQSKAMNEYLLPKLTRLNLAYEPGWECNALEHFLRSLQTNHTLKYLSGIKIPNHSSTQELAGLLQATQLCLQHNSALELLTLEPSDQGIACVWSSWLPAIRAGLAGNQILNYGLVEVTSHEAQPTRVQPHQGVRILRKREKILPYQTCRHLLEFDLKREAKSFAKQLEQAPANTLHTLSLEPWYPATGSRNTSARESPPVLAIVSFLHRATALQTLTLRHYIDLLPILEALKTHKTVKRFQYICQQ